MDKKRLAIKQARAIEAQAERLAAIEAVLAAPEPAVLAELVETEPLATAAQVQALAAQVETLTAQVGQVAEALTNLNGAIGAMAAKSAPQPQRQR